jgi:DNA-binding PadR family transcriptional regulator
MTPMSKSVSAQVAEFLPLNPPVFHLLMALSRGERHGYAMMREVEEDSAGAVSLGPGTLYYSLQKMLQRDLIEEADERADPDSAGERRRYYRITPFGREVAEAEARRLAQAVELARSRAFLGNA